MREVIPFKPATTDLNAIAYKIIGAALTVHRIVGIGFNAKAYKACLLKELDDMGMHYEVDIEFPMFYKNGFVDSKVNIGLIIENQIILEIVATDDLYEDDMFSVLNHLKQAELKLGLIINFKTKYLKGDAIRRVVNGTID